MTDARLQALERYTDIHLCGCGVLRCAPRETQGPTISGAYFLCCAAAGKGRVRTGDASLALEADRGVLIAPNQGYSLEADEFDPWTLFWLAFDGASAGACLRALEIGAEPFRCDAAALCSLAEEAQRLDAPGPENEFLLQAQLFRLLACLARRVPGQAEQPAEGKESQHVRRAAEYIRTHYSEGISVADVAAYLSLNRSYMTTLFQRVLGTSPQEYLARYRLARAEEHLTHSDATIAAIAYSCGYQDPQVFSKAFRQRYGLTPAKYRAAAAQKGTDGG